MNSSVRKLPAALVAGALLLSLTACGQGSGSQDSSSSAAASSSTAVTAATQSGDQSVLDKVKVTRNADGAKKPTVKVPSPVADDAAAGAKIINQGDGAELKQGQVLTLNIAAVQGSDGKAVSGDDYTSAKKVALTSTSFEGGLEDAYAVLQKAKVGADVGVLLPASLTGNVAQVWVMHVSDAKQATVTWKKATGSTPTEVSTQEKDGKYTITIPAGDAPKELKVKVLKKGTKGKAATSKSKVTAYYAGATWKDGAQFDGNFDASALSFDLSGVIKGWTKGLTGLKAGSEVMLTIPSDQAYGDNPTSGQPAGPLVFIVKITKVS